ncbi:hypothetical protein BD560DRAFT_490081 [Blakeslea trispora]|nr:hypothetical protein BD560DRAFT_490081 [Blakeslea trispora]
MHQNHQLAIGRLPIHSIASVGLGVLVNTSRVVARTPISADNLTVTHVPGMTRAKRRASCVFALRRHSETLSCVNALEDRAEQRLVFSHESLSEPLCLSLSLKRPDCIVYS